MDDRKKHILTLSLGTPRYGQDSAGYAYYVTIASTLTEEEVLKSLCSGEQKSGLYYPSYATPLRMSPYQEWSYLSRCLTFYEIEKAVKNGFNPVLKGPVNVYISWCTSYECSSIRLGAIIQSCVEKQQERSTCFLKPVTLEEMMKNGIVNITYKHDFIDFFLQLIQFGNPLFAFHVLDCPRLEI